MACFGLSLSSGMSFSQLLLFHSRICSSSFPSWKFSATAPVSVRLNKEPQRETEREESGHSWDRPMKLPATRCVAPIQRAKVPNHLRKHFARLRRMELRRHVAVSDCVPNGIPHSGNRKASLASIRIGQGPESRTVSSLAADSLPSPRGDWEAQERRRG